MPIKKVSKKAVSIDATTHEKLCAYAKLKTDGNMSQAFRELVDKYALIEDNVIPVIIKVPIGLRGDKENLTLWLESRTSGIIKALS